MSPGGWRNLRVAVQTLALLAFFYLLLAVRQDAVPVGHDVFFHLDPLVGIAASLGGRELIAPMVLGIVTLITALVLGRAWCGWVCPLGTILDWTKVKREHGKLPGAPSRWRSAKYGILFIILLGAAFGTLTMMVLDPVTMLFRTTANVVLPALHYLITGAETALYNIAPLQGALEVFDRAVRATILRVEQPFYLWNIVIALVFAAVLALNFLRRRFWCRYLCPLGALLGLCSRAAVVRHKVDTRDACVACKACVKACPMDIIDANHGFTATTSECTLCLDCMKVCPKGAVSFAPPKKALPQVFNPSRREFLSASAAAFAGAALLRLPPFFRDPVKNFLVRPPGAAEASLQGLCVRCGECTRVCPTGGLQPSVSSRGLDQIWTPVLVSRIGYCDFSCNACGQVCPTGAIPELSLEKKREAVIGIARIDEKRCIPFAEHRDCIVCEEMCPVPKKAIVLEDKQEVNAEGKLTTVRQPKVLEDLCIGCGICEYHCPLNGPSAIIIEPS